jgi:hypothetical protein
MISRPSRERRTQTACNMTKQCLTLTDIMILSPTFVCYRLQSTYTGAQNPRPASSSSSQRPFWDRDTGASGATNGYASRPSLRFEAESAYHEQYPRHDLSEAHQVPRRRVADDYVATHYNIVGGQGAKFDGTTMNKMQFQKWEAPRPTQAGPRQDPFEVSSANAVLNPRQSLPFEGKTSHQTEFPRYETYRPSEPNGRNPFASQLKVQGGAPVQGQYETETSRQFTRKTQPTCPAAAWETPVGQRTPHNW